MRAEDGHHESLGSVWKSTLGGSGGNGCEREAFYREMIRDGDGNRVPFAASEKMIYGWVIDHVHTLVFLRGESGQETTAEDAQGMVAKAVESCRSRGEGQSLREEDWAEMRGRATIAILRLIGAMPNRPTRGNEHTQLEGAPSTWLARLGDLWVPQFKTRVPNAIGARSLSGMPDYTLWDGDRILAWIDVKALSRAGSYPNKWMTAETVVYDYIVAAHNGGTPPEWHGYMEYRGGANAYWAIITARVSHRGTTALAEAYLNRWTGALAQYDPDALGFNTSLCGGCAWRKPSPDLGFPGCDIGRAVEEIAIGEK